MQEIKYMNVWRNHDGSNQWTDTGIAEIAISTREFCDTVASEYPKLGIYRAGILRIRFKADHA